MRIFFYDQTTHTNTTKNLQKNKFTKIKIRKINNVLNDSPQSNEAKNRIENHFSHAKEHTDPHITFKHKTHSFTPTQYRKFQAQVKKIIITK